MARADEHRKPGEKGAHQLREEGAWPHGRRYATTVALTVPVGLRRETDCALEHKRLSTECRMRSSEAVGHGLCAWWDGFGTDQQMTVTDTARPGSTLGCHLELSLLIRRRSYT
jgi:hypothetical protein